MRTQRCIASSLTRVGTSSKPPGRGYAKGDAKRWCSGFCTLMRWMVVRDLARMKLWLATRATPLTDMCLRRACRRTGCKAEGTVSKLLRMLPAFTKTLIPTRAGPCHFLFLVVGSLESQTTKQAHFVKFVLTIPVSQKSLDCMESLAHLLPSVSCESRVVGQHATDFPAPTFQSL